MSIHQGDALQDAWTSDYMQNIRQHFLENKQFEGCRECWRMQDMGLRSMRYDSYQYGTTEQQVAEPLKPTRIEINASNVCNLKCRICYPNASSKWIKEHGELYGSNEKIYYNLSLPNLEQVKQWGDSLEEVCFFGGEPLLSQENMALLDYFISTRNAGRMSILFNTNGTVFNDAVTERLRHFKRVRMSFSVDDIGARFEYQRKGAKWEEVAKNIDSAYRLSRSPEGQNIDFKICCTVSIFNIYYFPEFFDWFGTNYPGLRIFWNLLFDPWRLNTQILPHPVKTVITERLQKHVKSTYAMSEQETKTIEELVTFLNEDVEKPFDEFFWYVNRHDTFRKESFPTVFPEFYQIISEYKPDTLHWGISRLEDVIAKSLRTSESSDQMYSVLTKGLSEGGFFRPSADQALRYLESNAGELESKPKIIFAMFAALAGIPLDDAADKLSGAIVNTLAQIDTIDNDSQWNQKVSALRVCTGYSQELLSSIAISGKEEMVQNLSKLDLVDLLNLIENESGVFSSASRRLCAEKIDWNHSTVFRDVANACFTSAEIGVRWELCENWSELFRNSKQLINLYCTVLNFSSKAELSDAFIATLSSMDDDSNDPNLKENIRILEGLLQSEAGEKALVDFLQTGRSQFYASLKKQTVAKLLTVVEAKYGILVS